jgi:hypothetical protein
MKYLYQQSFETKVKKSGSTSMNFFDVGQLSEGIFVSQWDVDDTVVRQNGDGVEDGGFLSSSETGGGNKHACVFSRVCTRGPHAASGVPECLVDKDQNIDIISKNLMRFTLN